MTNEELTRTLDLITAAIRERLIEEQKGVLLPKVYRAVAALQDVADYLPSQPEPGQGELDLPGQSELDLPLEADEDTKFCAEKHFVTVSRGNAHVELDVADWIDIGKTFPIYAFADELGADALPAFAHALTFPWKTAKQGLRSAEQE